MTVVIKFKRLRITDSNDVRRVCKLITKRNPDVAIDEAYDEDEDMWSKDNVQTT